MLQVNLPRTEVKNINGRQLRRRRKGLNATYRALIAYELEAGSASIHELPRRDACALTGASRSYVAALFGASDEERERIKSGQLMLSTLQNKPPSDAYLDRLIVKIGANRVMAALDRYTRPQFKYAAE